MDSGAKQFGISLDIRNESRTDKTGILDLIIVLDNQSTNDFKGKINNTIPQGFRNISGNSLQVEMKSGEHLFIPVKIVVSNNAVSGESRMAFRLSDQQNKTMAEKEIPYTVTENNAMRITVETPLIYVNKATDSVEVRARVSNLGNRKQHVTIVFKIPEAEQGKCFYRENRKYWRAERFSLCVPFSAFQNQIPKHSDFR